MAPIAPPTPQTAPQTIFRFRREYNAWVADETMEDYALRYTPKGFRRWSEWRVANTAFGSLSFLALEAIGGAIALNYGFANAMWAILAVGVLIFLTGLPIAYCAARYGLDMDLLTRGAGFGYLGSTITSLIYAVFTFIFFALEAAIMALALQMVVDWPLQWCYVLSSLVILPLAMRGITLISRLQAWTQPLWLFLLLLPFVWIALAQPQLYRDFAGLSGLKSGSSQFDPLMFGAAAAVIFSLVVQIGEQVDILRFLPERTAANRWRWWGAVLVAGPGWIVMGMLKMAGGAFLAFAALQFEVGTHRAAEPTQMFLAGFQQVMQALGLPGLAVAVTVVFVVVSQVKINVTNAYAGSLAWSNFFARITRSHPGRVVWLVFNVGIATLLMTLGVFGALEKVLAVYSNVAIAWVGALVADLVINKPLGLSPRGIEFRRAHLYDFNPVGLGAMVLAAAVACCAYAGLLGDHAAAFSPFIALALSMALSPLLAWATGGRYYLARMPDTLWKPGESVRCAVCENPFESEDMARCPAYGAPICSLCCSLESRCHDRCKTGSRAADQLRAVAALLLPRTWAARVNFRLGQYLMVLVSLCAVMAFLVGVVYVQEGLETPAQFLRTPFLKVFALLSLLAAVCAWWVVLSTDSRRMAQDESERQTQLLLQEIEAHKRTDAELQAAKDRAESASMAKTRYVAGMTHELRSPLNSILGYTQILLKNPETDGWMRETLSTMQHSGQHMHALIDGSLELARIEAGRLRLDLAPLPLAELIRNVEGMLRPQAEARGLAFVVETLGTVPDWIRADGKRLRQILINLLSNAVRFTQQGEVRLRLDFRPHVSRIEVIDTGIGIEPQDLERIFLPFERGSAGRRASEAGTGLGLTITHLLTELMGGQLTVASRHGQGSTFTVRLYLPGISPDPAWRPTHAVALRPVIGHIAPRRTLLVVDDQPLQRQLLAGLLVPLGFTVREAASGRECLEIVRQAPPDLVLLDITMDDLDGWQTAALLRALRPAAALPIVFVSANQFDNEPARLAAAQCQGFVGKPIIESELLQALQAALQLEWVHDNTPAKAPASPGSPPASPAPPPHTLPADLREDLNRLARQGQAAAVRERLRSARDGLPGHAAALAQLQACADRFDFDALAHLLREPEHDELPDSVQAAAPRRVILVVDDALDTLRMLCDALAGEGYAVLAARDAEEAIERFEVTVPDGVLLDAVMPGTDGFALCRRIKATPPWAHVPIVFMTGLSETEQILRGFASGGVDYVVKPLRIPEVMVRLATHVANAQAARLAREAVDVAGLGVVVLDGQDRIAWRSPQATRWLEAAFGGHGDATAGDPARWLAQAQRQGEASTPLPGGLQLQARHLGASGLAESMLLLSQGPAAGAAAPRLPPVALTPRETEVLSWLAKGKTNRDIADILGMSPRTVNKHLEHIFEKLGVETRTAAAALAGQLLQD